MNDDRIHHSQNCAAHGYESIRFYFQHSLPFRDCDGLSRHVEDTLLPVRNHSHVSPRHLRLRGTKQEAIRAA
jgi:hypothetical protein